MPPPGRKLRERHQDEGALVQAGVRQNGGSALTMVPIAQLMVCKQVEVDHPRRPALSAYSAVPMFKLQQAREKLRRRQRGLEFSHAVYVPWLAIVGHGLATIPLRASADADVLSVQGAERRFQSRAGLSES